MKPILINSKDDNLRELIKTVLRNQKVLIVEVEDNEKVSNIDDFNNINKLLR